MIKTYLLVFVGKVIKKMKTTDPVLERMKGKNVCTCINYELLNIEQLEKCKLSI